MLVKWIRCTVGVDDRDAFDAAQQGWRPLADLSGFCVQVGGWNAEDRSEASVFAVWANHAAYHSFMQNHHDRIEADAKQRGTYQSISVQFFDVVLHMNGVGDDWITAFATAQLLRLAHCMVYPAREAHFQDVQERIWSPGMRAAGMSAGLFARASERPEYLVTSAWSTVAQHSNYRANPFPQLRKKAQVEADVASLSGVLLNLKPKWMVRLER